MEAALALFLFVIVILIVPWAMAPALLERGRPFTSDRERRLWLWALAVVVAIYSTLGPAETLAGALRERNLLRTSFALVLLLVPAALAVGATALLGWIDEGIQAILPNRVYDIRDVGFNALAGLMAVAAGLVLAWVRQRFGKRRAD